MMINCLIYLLLGVGVVALVDAFALVGEACVIPEWKKNQNVLFRIGLIMFCLVVFVPAVTVAILLVYPIYIAEFAINFVLVILHKRKYVWE